MKWLVVSDSHGHIEYMSQAIEAEEPDRVLHLGDMLRDGAKLQAAFPDLPVEQVRGNCDGWSGDEPVERELFFGDKRVWMLHGHTFQVKMGVGMLVSEAHTRGESVVVFGHTHDPMCDRDGSLWVMNPGTCSGMPRATYGVIETRDGQLYCRIGQCGRTGEQKRRWFF